MAFDRRAGILLHPTSLPGNFGGGDLGQNARTFVDSLQGAGITLWQMLPLGPTGGANSPYQSLSSYAGNPLLISLERLVMAELLNEVPSANFSAEQADFEAAEKIKSAALREAFDCYGSGGGTESFRNIFEKFRQKEAWWLDDFCLFMALKSEHNGAAWFQWSDPEIVAHNPDAIKRYREKLASVVAFNEFVQFVFFSQWQSLKKYANERGVKLVGDIPIYVAHDSADVWASPEYFEIDKRGQALKVAGVPPDYFCDTGQLWGNPIYKWDKLEADGFAWWIKRIGATLKMVDLLRIDHFRGFEAYWEVPAGEETAINGTWIKGPCDKLFNAVRDELGELPIIAEDLGVITPEVDALRLGQGLPGMKILQFAFCEGAENYLPHTYEKNCVVYTATHDNDTTLGWYKSAGPDYAHMNQESLAAEHDKARRYLARGGDDIVWDLIRLALSSVADTAVIPMQDLLVLDNDCRMNRPGISDGQWMWRMTDEQLKSFPGTRLRELVDLYDRLPKN